MKDLTAATLFDYPQVVLIKLYKLYGGVKNYQASKTLSILSYYNHTSSTFSNINSMYCITTIIPSVHYTITLQYSRDIDNITYTVPPQLTGPPDNTLYSQIHKRLL